MIKLLSLIGILVLGSVLFVGPTFLIAAMWDDRRVKDSLPVATWIWGVTESIILFTWICSLKGWV